MLARSAAVVAVVVAMLSGVAAFAFVPSTSSAAAQLRPARQANVQSQAAAAARHTARASRQVLKAVMQDAGRKPVLITGNNIDVTPALNDYVNKKIDKIVEKLGSVVTKVDVHLSVNRNPRVPDGHIAEVTVFAKGTVIRAAESSDNMYASIDLVTDRMARKLRKYKERGLSQKRSRTSVSETGRLAEERLEDAPAENGAGGSEAAGSDYDDGLPHVDMSIVKRKSFPMPPCTVEDAVVALEYIEHDFYVFRNSATGEVNVVYKRNHGGIGLIEPERD